MRSLIEGREAFFPKYDWVHPDLVDMILSIDRYTMLISANRILDQHLANAIETLWLEEPSLRLMYRNRHLV